MEDRPWFEWKRGKSLTQNSLAKLLKPYKLLSNTKRIGNERAKGYDVEKMKAAFMPYLPLPPISNRDTVTTYAGQGLQRNSKRDKNKIVTVEKPRKPLQGNDCHGVTV